MHSSPRERRHEKTRQAILEAARKIIAADGAEALSMRAIAQRIDYSPAGLYEYFDSKEEIVAAVCEQGHRRLTEYMLRAAPDLPPHELLFELGLAYMDFAEHNPDFFMLMFTNPATGVAPGATPQEMAAAMQKEGSSFPLLLGAIERGIEEGIFKPRPGYGALEMAFTAWAMVHGLAMLRIGHLRHFPGDFSATEREAMRRIGAGLMTDLPELQP
jgi:AcrR family transcriptional regulator